MAGSLSAAADGPPEADPIARRRRGHKTPHNVTSHPLRRAFGELILLPVWERHPKLNLGQRPLA